MVSLLPAAGLPGCSLTVEDHPHQDVDKYTVCVVIVLYLLHVLMPVNTTAIYGKDLLCSPFLWACSPLGGYGAKAVNKHQEKEGFITCSK